MKNAVYWLFFGIILFVFFATYGCIAGVDTICISSTPEGADLYVNSQYTGTTPTCFPSKWTRWLIIFPTGDTNVIKITKEGYKPYLRTIPFSEIDHRHATGNCKSGSKYGLGYTYPFDFKLELDESATTPEGNIIIDKTIE